MKNINIVTSSEDSIQIQFPQKICEEVNSMIGIFVKRFRETLGEDSGVEEIVPTYCAVTVYYDSRKCHPIFLKNSAEAVFEEMSLYNEEKKSSGKVVEIPVCYDDEYAPDLSDVAEHTGLSKEEVIQLHLSKDYPIYMLGFLPGFPYLGGMDERLETPRLETPRSKIPAGSVAIGGKQAGLYPIESPGGWRIIGRTPLKVFDQTRNPACLYEADDKIRFVRISKEEFVRMEKSLSSSSSEAKDSSAIKRKRYVCTSGIKILEGGILTTVQDPGRKGFQSSGISQSGVMDAESFEYANYLLKNEENAACLEATVLGPTVQFVLPCDFALTGGDCAPLLNENPVPLNQVVHAEAGDILKCGFITSGLRSYIAFKGGLLVPEILGSRSTNIKSKTGGCFGRKIEKGDELAVGNFTDSGKSFYEKKVPVKIPRSGEELILHCTRGSQFSLFADDKIRKFQNTVYTILAESDRMGIRFDGESLDSGKTDIISDAIPFGAVQITSAGLPVVMASDRQTTGGYAKIASVTKHSMCLLAQASPGTKVRFQIEDDEEFWR